MNEPSFETRPGTDPEERIWHEWKQLDTQENELSIAAWSLLYAAGDPTILDTPSNVSYVHNPGNIRHNLPA
jgi:hypothetical protein